MRLYKYLQRIIGGGIHKSYEKKIIEIRNKFIKYLPNNKVVKKTLRFENIWLYPDIVIDNNIIVEFFGNYWHANPIFYKSIDIVHHNKTAQEIWNFDKKRLDLFVKMGYNVFVIWENDYVNDKEKTINNLLLKIKNGKNKDN